MGEKKSKKNEGAEKKNSGEVVEEKEGEGKKNDGNLTVVLNWNCYCEGCVAKVVKATRSVGGVEEVRYHPNSEKLTVIGKVDPVTLREKVQQKTHKHIEVLRIPEVKSDRPAEKMSKKNEGGDKKNVVLKSDFHCDGKAKGGDAGAGDDKKKQNKEKDSKENKGGGGKKKITGMITPPKPSPVHVELGKHIKQLDGAKSNEFPPKKDGGDNKKAKGGDEKGKGDKGKGKGKK